MSTGTEPIAPVLDALAAALAEDSWGAGSLSRVGTPQAPSASLGGMPVAPALPDPSPDALSMVDLADLVESPGRAMGGDQASVERLGRAASRRDPVAGLDPLPWGRDAVTYSTASVSTGREAGTHWPELVAFRLSDEFPGGHFDPFSAAGHAAENAVPAALFPEAPPDLVPSRLPRLGADTMSLPSGTHEDVPAWFDGATSNGPPDDTFPAWLGGAAPNEVPPHAIPTWLEVEPELRRDRGAGARPKPADVSNASAESPRGLHGIRADFPALDQEVNGHPLVWLDSGATTQKPRAVIEAVQRFYARDNSNVHRGAHALAARATDAYEAARGKVQRFLGARSPKEIVFVDGATEAINLVAQSWGRRHLRSGDVVLVTHLEHHSNIVPWMQVCEATGAVLRVIPVDDAGDVRLDAYESMLDERVKLVALPQVSNAIGTVVPVAPMAAMAHRHGARVLVDGSQAVAHVPVDVLCLGADFYAFSGHKIYGPTGIGALYGREEVLEEMPPWQGGGSMIEDVTFERVRYAALPQRFEAGTPNLAGAVGLGVALDYVERLGRPAVFAHEQALLSTLLSGLATVPGLTVVGAPVLRAAVVSFVLAGHTPQAVGAHLDRAGIAVRSGHHCAQPILRRFGHEATVRPSLGLYNDDADVARLIDALHTLRRPSARDGAVPR